MAAAGSLARKTTSAATSSASIVRPIAWPAFLRKRLSVSSVLRPCLVATRSVSARTISVNAAGNFVAPAEEISPNGWRAVVGIVLDGTFHCSREFALRATGGGQIVNIVATYAFSGGPGNAHSAAAKAGVVNLTRSLAVEWAPRGIRVNAIAPGPVDTGGAGAKLWSTPEVRERVLSQVPAGRFATGEEIAGVCTFLVSDHAAYVTGDVIVADGGFGLNQLRLG